MKSMRVRVLFFGQLKEIVGLAQEDAELSEGARVEDLFERYGRRFPKLAEFRPSVAASLNQEYAEWRAPLAAGDEVAFLPPVSGGQQAAVAEDIFLLVREAIRPRELVERLEGAGRWRRGRLRWVRPQQFQGPTDALLGIRSLRADGIRENARDRRRKFARNFRVHRIAIVHRLGRLEIGETSVLIAVSSAHRAAAFDACRYAIDTLKRTVPIWKKEFFVGGAVWAEGESLPQKAISGLDESTS